MSSREKELLEFQKRVDWKKPKILLLSPPCIVSNGANEEYGNQPEAMR